MHNNLSSKNLPLKPGGGVGGGGSNKGFNHVILPHFSDIYRYFIYFVEQLGGDLHFCP